jgi:divalent metal cation (Fe/Co/Zn/Cd) transporter
MHAEAALVVDGNLTVVEAHNIANEAHHTLLHALPKLADATVHVSPRDTDGTNHHEALAHHRKPH